MTRWLPRLNIAPKLFLTTVGLVVTLVFALGLTTFLFGRQALETTITESLISSSLEKEAAFHNWVDEGLDHVTTIAQDPSIIEDAVLLSSSDAQKKDEAVQDLNRRLGIWVGNEKTMETFMVIHPVTGQVLVSTTALELGRYKEDRPYFVNGKTGPFFEYPFYSLSTNDIATIASAPILGEEGELLAVLAGRLHMEDLAKIIHTRTGNVASQEALIVNRANLLVVSPTTAEELQPFVTRIDTDAVNLCLEGKSGVINAPDYRNVPVVANYRWLPDAQLCMVVKVNQEEALRPIYDLSETILIISLLAIIGGTLMSLTIARAITQPIADLAVGVAEVSRGNLDFQIPVRGQDEIATLTDAFNQMATARMRIARNRDRLLGILEATPDFVITADMDGNLFYCNAAAREILGIAPEEPLTGRTLASIHPQDDLAAITQKRIPEAIAQGTWTGDGTLKRADGRVVPVSEVIIAHRADETDEITGGETKQPISYLSIVARDLSQRRAMEIALRQARDELELRVQERTADLAESEHRYRLLARNFPDGAVFFYDRDLRFRIAGGAKLRDLGLSEESMEGHTVEEVFSPEAVRRIKPIYQAALSGKTTLEEVEYGGRVYTEYTLPVRTAEEVTVGGLVIIQDITSRRQIEAALAEKAIDLARSNADLEQVSYVTAHDLQEPLRKMRAFSDWLMRKHGASAALDAHSLDYLSRISSSAERMQHLLDDMLIYSRINSPDQNFDSVNLNELMAKILARFDGALSGVSAQIGVDVLPTIVAHPEQMEILFRQIISNSIKFRQPDKELVIHIRCVVLEEQGTCRISIQDNGIGFDEKYLDRIFLPVQRLHNRTQYKGTGMGLAICQRIVDQHDGQITARSQPNQGTTFVVTLPLRTNVPDNSLVTLELAELIDKFRADYHSNYNDRVLDSGWKRYDQHYEEQ